MTLYNLLKNVITRGNTVDMEKKLETFRVAKKITDDEHNELVEMLNGPSK